MNPRNNCIGDKENTPGVRSYGMRPASETYDVYCYIDRLKGTSSPVPWALLRSKNTLHTSTSVCRRLGCRDSPVFSLPSLRRCVLRNAAGAVHLRRSPAVLREAERHAGLCWPTARRLEAGPGPVLRGLAGRRQPALPHREPAPRLRWGRAGRQDRVPAPQPDRLPRPAVPAPRLLLQRYTPSPAGHRNLSARGEGFQKGGWAFWAAGLSEALHRHLIL